MTEDDSVVARDLEQTEDASLPASASAGSLAEFAIEDVAEIVALPRLFRRRRALPSMRVRAPSVGRRRHAGALGLRRGRRRGPRGRRRGGPRRARSPASATTIAPRRETARMDT